MAGFLFNDLIFGPVYSRRLGRSLGINLLPINAKWCNFDCVYCECGWSAHYNDSDVFPDSKQIVEMLENVLTDEIRKHERIDAITFAGNGEPTLHPDFAWIIENVVVLRNRLMPNAQVAVLTNATMLHKKTINNALKLADKAILKLDTAIQRSYDLINQPFDAISVQEVIESIKQFQGDIYIQTMFFTGTNKGVAIDNTSEEELKLYFTALKYIQPKQVMIYSIDRATPGSGLQKVPVKKLEEISKKIQSLGFEVLLTP